MRLPARLLHCLNRLRWRLVRPITVGVRLILAKDSSVLLVRHTYLPQWYLPGGGVKRGEPLEKAARREAAEEVGAALGDLRLLGVYSNFYEHKSDHIVVFTCTEFTASGDTDGEIETWRFFGVADLPEGVSPGTGRRIREYVEGGGAPVVGPW